MGTMSDLQRMVYSIAGVFLTAYIILATSVIANENRNVGSHESIRKEIAEQIKPMAQDIGWIKGYLQKESVK